MFFRKKKETPVYVDDRISIVVKMTNGDVIKGKCLPNEFTDAVYDLGRHSPNPDSLIYILSVIAHPADIESIERA